jgi:hypothetical protein
LVNRLYIILGTFMKFVAIEAIFRL